MANEDKDKGFKAGTEGKTANDNPNQSGPTGRMVDILTGQIDRTDQSAKDWESGRQAGEASVKNNK